MVYVPFVLRTVRSNVVLTLSTGCDNPSRHVRNLIIPKNTYPYL